MELLILAMTNAKAYMFQVGGAYLTMELLIHVLTNAKAYTFQVGGRGLSYYGATDTYTEKCKTYMYQVEVSIHVANMHQME